MFKKGRINVGSGRVIFFVALAPLIFLLIDYLFQMTGGVFIFTKQPLKALIQIIIMLSISGVLFLILNYIKKVSVKTLQYVAPASFFLYEFYIWFISPIFTSHTAFWDVIFKNEFGYIAILALLVKPSLVFITTKKIHNLFFRAKV